MSLHIHCDTSNATMLIAVPCDDNLLRFPNDNSFWPGITFKVNSMMGINEQLIDAARLQLRDNRAQLNIWQEYSALLQIEGQPDTTLFVSRLDRKNGESLLDEWKTWQTLPALIRTLPKDRNRLAFLKAWQILSGGLEESTKALDVNEVVKHLKSLEKDAPKS